MDWKVGQKVAALCNVAIYDYKGNLIEIVIEFDQVYIISSIESGCCMSLLDVGKTYNEKGTALSYICGKCKKQYCFKENEPIQFNEKWFRPIDENESMVEKAVRKISNLFSKKKKTVPFIRIKIRTPIPMPFIETEPRPIIEPERKIEVQPKRKRELV